MKSDENSCVVMQSELGAVILKFSHNNYGCEEDLNKPIFCEIVAVTDGEGIAETEGKTLALAEGDIVFFDSLQTYKIVSCKKEKPLSVLSLSFDITSFLNDDYRVFDKLSIDRFFSQIKTSQNLIKGSRVTAKKVMDLLLDLEEELIDCSAISKPVIKALVVLIFTHIVRHFSDTFESVSIQKVRHYSEVQKTMIYINEHLSENITLENLAKIAHMNKTYYSTVFKNSKYNSCFSK